MLFTVGPSQIELSFLTVTRAEQVWFVVPMIPVDGGFFEGTLSIQLLRQTNQVIATASMTLLPLDGSGIETPGRHQDRQACTVGLGRGAAADAARAQRDLLGLHGVR